MFQFRNQNVDPFYSDYGDGDFIRFPLIKPYEATYLNKDTGWMINLPISPRENGISSYLDILLPEKVAVKNNVIMVYTSYKPEHLQASPEGILYWFVLLPEGKKEIGFSNETEFLSFIKGYGINNPDWQSIDAAFGQFRKTGCLSWIPGCR